MKWLLAAVAAIVVLAIAAMAALPRVVDSRRVQSLILSSAAQALARPVKFRSASVSVLPRPTVRLHGLEIAEDPAFGVGPFVRLDDADLRLKLWPLVRGHVEFATLVLERPTINLVRGPGGRWNFASLGAAREAAGPSRPPRASAPGAPPPLVSRIVIARGLITYERRTASGIVERRQLEDVDGTLAPHAGALSFSGSARVVPPRLTVKVTDGTLVLGGARALTDGSLRARVEFGGADLQWPVAAALGGEPAVGGTIVGHLDVGGTLGRPRAAGEIELRNPTLTRTSPACEEPRRRTLGLSTLKANVSWRDGRLIAAPVTTGIGRGTATARLAAGSTSSMRAELSDLVLERIPLERVLVDLLCQGYAVAAPLDLTGTFMLSPIDPARTLSGSGRFRLGPGQVVGARALALLGGLVRAAEAAPLAGSPLEFDSIAGSYEVANGVVSTRDLVYASRAMKARVTGTYALASGRVSADVVLEHERGVVQAKVAGTAESPSIRVTPSLARRLDRDQSDRDFKELLKRFR